MTFRLLAERVPGTWQLFAGIPTGDEVVSWAVHALTSGLDTPSLRILGGFSSPASWFEVEKDFRGCLQELGLASYPSEADARRFHAGEIAEQLLAGTTDVESALNEFHQTVISPLHHPGDLQAWCDLADGLHPERRNPISIDRRNMLAFQAARALLDQVQSPSA
jgi:hypothetical protein